MQVQNLSGAIMHFCYCILCSAQTRYCIEALEASAYLIIVCCLVLDLTRPWQIKFFICDIDTFVSGLSFQSKICPAIEKLTSFLNCILFFAFSVFLINHK